MEVIITALLYKRPVSGNKLACDYDAPFNSPSQDVSQNKYAMSGCIKRKSQAS